MEEDTNMQSGTYIMCPVCGFVPSKVSPEQHIEEMHRHE